MTQSENRPEFPTMPQSVVETAPQVQTRQIQQAMEEMERKKNRAKVTRRVLLGVVGVGACAGAIEATPFLVQKAGLYTQQELDKAVQAGVAQGREELLAELRNLEGIGLDTAIAIAKLTKFGVQYIVKPLADLGRAIGSDVIGALAAGVAEAILILRSIPSVIPGRSGALSTLATIERLLIIWRANVS